jgi:phosphonate degradation associated HDIG domain protein
MSTGETNSKVIVEHLLQELAGRRGESLVATLFAFMQRRGSAHYDEVVTQLEHGLQCAALGRTQGLDEHLVTAALLHDFGHLLESEEDAGESDFRQHDLCHEETGAELLSRFFPPAVIEPIRLHVAAKRYLCTTDPQYFEGLSMASKRSFLLQGGPLAEAEREQLGNHPYLQAGLALRRLDDQGKQADWQTPPLAAYQSSVTACLKPEWA